MSIVCRPVYDNETDLLKGNENKNLIITNLEEEIIADIPSPPKGWTHEALENIDYYKYSQLGWNAY